MAIRNANLGSSCKQLDLSATTFELTSQGIVLPTSKPGTPTFSHTVIASEFPTHTQCLYDCDYMFVVTLDTIVGAASSVSIYFEAYVDGVLQDSQKTNTLAAGEYAAFYASVDVNIGSVVEVYCWQSVADILTVEEIHYASVPYNIYVSNTSEYIINNIDEEVVPAYSRVGSGTSMYLRHNDLLSGYNQVQYVDDVGGDVVIANDSTYGVASIYGTALPYIGAVNHSSARWPATRNVIGNINYSLLRR